MADKQDGEHWDYIIEPRDKIRPYDLRELRNYRDLIRLFVRRDFISLYKQTILGPLWILIQPILTTLIFAVVFGQIAKIDTGVPPVLFYLIGIIIWTYFADCVSKTSETFIQNQNIFGKVYFPRMVMPISIIITNLIKLGIHFLIFLVIYTFLLMKEGAINYGPNWYLLLIPLLILIVAMFSMGIGISIAGLTTKYKDLRFLIQFGIQLGLYITPIVYPLNRVDPAYQWILLLNPMAGIIESFKMSFFGPDYAVFSWFQIAYSFFMALLVLMIGIQIFRRIERTFMDSI